MSSNKLNNRKLYRFEEFILYPIDRQPAEICQSLQGTRLINIYVHPGNVEDSIASTVINTSDLERAVSADVLIILNI